MTTPIKYQVMPPLSPDEYQELHDDIKTNGVLVPVVEDENGVLIDGHHRQRIAFELGVPCPVEIIEGKSETEKRGMAFTLNLKRRHLNREQRRALIAESLKQDPQLSNREHARRAGVSTTTVGTVRGELEESGDVSKLDTLTDSMGRKQPATRPASQPPRPVPEPTESETCPPPDPRPEPLTKQFTTTITELNRILGKFHRIQNNPNYRKNQPHIADLHKHDIDRAITELTAMRNTLN